MDKVAIFMDYDNVFWAMIEYYGKDPLIEKEVVDEAGNLTGSKINLIDIIFNKFCNDYVCIFNAYADFQPITKFDKGSDNMYKLQSKRVTIKNVFGNSNQYENRKNASDIELSIDVIETLYSNPDIDTYVIISADSDMIPIVNRLKYKNKNVILYCLENACSKDRSLLSYANEVVIIEDKENLDLTYKVFSDLEIKTLYLGIFLDELIKLHIHNKQNSNVIGFTWFKNKILTNGLAVNGKKEDISGENILNILDYMCKSQIINYGFRPYKYIILNEQNQQVSQKLNPLKKI